MTKIILAVSALVVVGVGALFFMRATARPAPSEVPQLAPAPATIAATSTYATTTYSLVYPADFSVNPDFSNLEVSAKKPISGIQLTIPQSMATGTSIAADSFLSVEELPRAKQCTGDIYLKANVRAQALTENGVAYSLATSTAMEAGGRLDEYVYALVGSSPCTAIRYSIHSNGSPAGMPEDSALLKVFDDIRASLSFHESGSATASAHAPTTAQP